MGLRRVGAGPVAVMTALVLAWAPALPAVAGGVPGHSAAPDAAEAPTPPAALAHPSSTVASFRGRSAPSAAIVVAPPVGQAPAPGQVSAVLTLADIGSRAALAQVVAQSRTAAAASRARAAGALAPPVAARDRVVAWAHQHDLRVTETGRYSVAVSGPGAVLAAALATPPALRGSHLQAPPGSRVPPSLAGAVTAVSALGTEPVVRALGVSTATSVSPSMSLSGAGYTGDQLRDAYGAPRDPTAGAGVTVATVQFSGFNPVDVENYAQAAGIPLFNGQITVLPLDGASVSTVVGTGDLEVDTDIEAILAAAPMARQIVYIAPNTSGGQDAAYARLATDAQTGAVQVASSSWGQCEAQLYPPDEQAISQDLQNAVAAGLTFSAASGDNGSADCKPATGSSAAAVDYPASDPSTVAVGGTSLSGAADVQAGYQQAWTSSGGGVSSYFPQPPYQSGAGTPTGRNVPDVALLADPSTPFAAVSRGYYQSVGGTSVASPLFAGLLASALSEAGRTTGVGDVHAALYAHPDAFQQVVAGSNGAFTAHAGYNDVTGLGAPRFGALAAALSIPPLPRAYFHAVTPTRIVDTRVTGGTTAGPLGPGGQLTVGVAGTGSVPATGVTAVALTVTAISPSAPTALSVFPAGSPTGTLTSSVNASSPGGTPNLVIAKVDSAGRFTVFNHAATVNVAVDLDGYFASTGGGSGFTATSPQRLLDTRHGVGASAQPVGQGGTVTVQVTGHAGVPTGATAVAVNLTGVDATTPTYISAFPTGDTTGATTSVLDLASAGALADMAVVPLSPTGSITLYNDRGHVQLVADVLGYYGAGGAALLPVDPVRVLDTRPAPATPLGPGGVGSFLVAADGSRATGAVTNLTGISPTAATYLTLFPYGAPVATATATSTLNLAAHAVRANLATPAVTPGSPSALTLFNKAGSVNVAVDVDGFFATEVIASASRNVVYGALATTVGLLVWLAFVSRWTLLWAAWMCEGAAVTARGAAAGGSEVPAP